MSDTDLSNKSAPSSGAAQAPAGSLKTFNKEDIETYQHVRGEIHYEYTNMANRLNWLLTGQAFLFGAHVLGIPRDGGPFALERSVYHPTMPILGLTLSFIIYVSCLAALLRIYDYRSRQLKLDERLAGWDGCQPPRRAALVLGLGPPVLIPACLFTAWFYLSWVRQWWVVFLIVLFPLTAFFVWKRIKIIPA